MSSSFSWFIGKLIFHSKTSNNRYEKVDSYICLRSLHANDLLDFL